MNEGDQASSRRPSWTRGCMFLLAICLAAMVCFCSLSGLGIRYRLIDPPWIVRHVGPVVLVARSTLTPQCALEFPCGKPINVFDPNLRSYYVVWLVVSWPGADKPKISSYRLMMQVLDRK